MRNVVYLSDHSDRGLKNGGSAFALPRLELEMALELDRADDRPPADVIRSATDAAGGDLLFVLPSPNSNGDIRQDAMIRLREDEQDCLLLVCQNDDGYAIYDEDRINPDLVEFARATVNVMQHLRADDSVIRPLVDELH